MSHPQSRKALPAPLPNDLREAALAAHKAGERAVEIADRLNLKAVTVRSWIRRQRKKDSPAQPVLTPVVEIVQPQEEIEIPSELPEKQSFYTSRMEDAACRLANHVSKLDGEGLVKAADRLKKADETARRALKLETDRPQCAIQIAVLAAPVPESKSKPLHSFLRPRRISE
jgi:transposase-like protein